MNLTFKILATVLLFVFTAVLFPTLQDACRVATGELSGLIINFPIILLVIEAILPIYFVYEDRKT